MREKDVSVSCWCRLAINGWVNKKHKVDITIMIITNYCMDTI